MIGGSMTTGTFLVVEDADSPRVDCVPVILYCGSSESAALAAWEKRRAVFLPEFQHYVKIFTLNHQA